MEKKKGLNIITCIIIFIVMLGVVCVGFFLGYKYGTKRNETPEPNNVVTAKAATDIEKQEMEKIAKLVFVESKKNLKAEDLTADQKINIALQLTDGGYEASGEDLRNNFKKYFGSDIKLEFPNIKCGMEHESEDQNYMYIFDKEKDKYVYNEKHPGHGGGTANSYSSYLEGKTATVTSNKYVLEAPVIIYGGVYCDDVSGCHYEAAYKTYDDAKNKTNALVDLTKNETYWTGPENEPQKFEEKKLYDDYKDKLNSVKFVFEKDGDNLIFKSYSMD